MPTATQTVVFFALVLAICFAAETVTRGWRTQRRLTAELNELGAYDVYFDSDHNVTAVAFSDHIRSQDIGLYPTIERIYLSGSVVVDADLAHIRDLPNVNSIDLSNTVITNAGLRHLTRLRQLRELSLHQTPITDDAIPLLAAICGLQELDLSFSPVTIDGVHELQRLRPGLLITHCDAGIVNSTLIKDSEPSITTEPGLQAF